MANVIIKPTSTQRNIMLNDTDPSISPLCPGQNIMNNNRLDMMLFETIKDTLIL